MQTPEVHWRLSLHLAAITNLVLGMAQRRDSGIAGVAAVG